MARPIDIDGFEELFRSNPDPWDYATSPFEAYKRRVLLNHVGAGPFGRVLELACANGVTTEVLAKRALRITALDGSSVAIAEARARLGRIQRVKLRQARLPEEMPRERYDLIVVSEIVYYMKRRAYERMARALMKCAAPGGRVVVLHHHLGFADASVRPELAHREFVGLLAGGMTLVSETRTNRFCVATLAVPRHH